MAISEHVKKPGEEPHIACLNAEFPFQGYITDTAHRGMSLHQLHRVISFMSLHCGSWHDLAPPHMSATSGQPLCKETLNLYHFNDWAILPATKEKNCAFIELLSGCDQVPQWFISHWWGEVIQDFAICVEKHVQLRRLSPNAIFFWICAYANRQHSLAKELLDDPKQTSFFRALRLAEGVLLILDEHATAFRRIWCGFEESIALTDVEGRKAPMLLDIATTQNGKVSIITQGIVEDDRFHHYSIFANVFGHPGERIAPVAERWIAPWNKALREKDFPVKILEFGIHYQVEQGQASVDLDRKRILNSMAHRSLNLEPLEEHANYTTVNQKLSSTFALAGWRQLASKGMVQDFRLPEKISADTTLRSVVLDFQDIASMDDNAVVQIASALPLSVSHLELRFISNASRKRMYGGHITTIAVIACARKLPCNLRYLALEFTTNDLITDEGICAVAAGLPSSLEELYLRFNFCRLLGDPSFCALSKYLPKRLRILELGFVGTSITDHGLIALAASLPEVLNEFVLNLSMCTALSDKGLIEIVNAVPATVKSLSVFAACCPKVTHKTVESMAEKLPPLLETLNLGFMDCPRVTSRCYVALADGLPESVQHLMIGGPTWVFDKYGGWRTPDDFRRWARKRSSRHQCCRLNCVKSLCIWIFQHFVICFCGIIRRRESKRVRRERGNSSSAALDNNGSCDLRELDHVPPTVPLDNQPDSHPALSDGQDLCEVAQAPPMVPPMDQMELPGIPSHEMWCVAIAQ